MEYKIHSSTLKSFRRKRMSKLSTPNEETLSLNKEDSLSLRTSEDKANESRLNLKANIRSSRYRTLGP